MTKEELKIEIGKSYMQFDEKVQELQALWIRMRELEENYKEQAEDGDFLKNIISVSNNTRNITLIYKKGDRNE